MHQEEHPVAAFGDIDLHDWGARIIGILQRLDRILGIAGGRAAAMGGNQHPAFLAHAIHHVRQARGAAGLISCFLRRGGR